MDKLQVLRALEARAKNCTMCGLCRTRTNVVFGTGSPDARIMFVGEAPGFHEDRRGIPFCGKAGLVLDRLLASVNIKREDVYIANLLKCRPPDNRDPLPEEMAACREYTEGQMEAIKPQVICSLGRYALQYILARFSIPGRQSIGRAHGQVFSKDDDLFSSVRIVALYHPAVATYNPNAFEMLKKDFAVLANL